MSNSKSLSVSGLFFTSPCSNIWLLLLLPMLSDQACQMSFIFGLGLTHFHGDISFLHACIKVLGYFSCFWASAAAVEPRSSTEVCLTWGPPCRSRHRCRAPPSIRAFLVKVTSAVTPWGTCHFLSCALPHAQDMVLSPTTFPQHQKMFSQSKYSPHQG